jgi:hypothetical protein
MAQLAAETTARSGFLASPAGRLTSDPFGNYSRFSRFMVAIKSRTSGLR